VDIAYFKRRCVIIFLEPPHLFSAPYFFQRFYDSVDSSKTYLISMLKNMSQVNLYRRKREEFVFQLQNEEKIANSIKNNEYIPDWVILNPRTLFVMMSFYSEFRETENPDFIEEDFLILCATLATKRSFDVTLLFDMKYRKKVLG
jgi:hypothetical protein